MTALPTEEEALRLQSLRKLKLLDTEQEPEFDELVQIAAAICETPISTMTLIDEHRQWFKAAVGVTHRENPRDISFCTRAIERPELFVVEDASKDERFAENPLVTAEGGIRFYAGMPLEVPGGSRVGTLCVIDTVPRTLSRLQRETLQVLSRQVMARMAMRLQRQDLQAALLELEEANRRLKLLSVTDALTGLHNRRAFEERLEMEFSLARRKNRVLAVVMIDIDFFKNVNDTLGHAAGDDVLCEVAKHLSSSVRLTDMAARFGGEEFAVILSETTAESAHSWAERLAELMAQAEWRHRPVTLSIGIAQLRDEVANMTELVARADQALYVAKRTGRARAVIFRDAERRGEITPETVKHTAQEAGAQ
jgi:diguanylate cyclase (GGDEF)-like protein